MGQSYEYLIKKFADLTNKKAGEFYTPRSVVRLMVNILDPREGESIYDPACGTGGMLLEAIHHVRQRHGDDRTLWGKLFGQEKNLTTSAIARMNLFLHGAADFQIVRGDTLRNPAFFAGDNLATFDCVIANPPFSLEKWGEEVWLKDPYGRNFAGHAAGQERRLRLGPAHAQVDGAGHRPDGRGPAPRGLVPHGQGGRDPPEDPGHGPAGSGHRPRPQPVLRHRAGRLHPGVSPAQGQEPEEEVLILDASREFKTGRAQNELLPEHVERIYGWYRDFQDVEGVARVVSLDEIAANDHNLNIPRYVEPKVDQEVLTVDEAMRRLRDSAQAAFAAEERLIGLLKREGLLK